MTQDTRTQVAIVGAGPVGMTLATLLAKRGVRVTILDAKTELSNKSRAVAIFPRSLEILHESGALDGVLAGGQVNRNIRMRRAGSYETLLDFPFPTLAPLTTCDYAVAIPQDRTERAMLDVLEGCPTADIRFGCAVEDWTAEGDTVRLTLASGDTVTADYLVGCDGAKSMVRETLGWELKGKTYPTRAFLADVRVTQEADSNDGWRVATELAGFVSCIRYADRTWRIIDQAVPREESEDELRARGLRHARALFGENGVEALIWASSYRKHERTADRYVEGRVILAGDAAHLNSPAGGQGMNTGLRDAFNLAWKLDLALSGGADAGRLLRSYETEQRTAFLDAVGPFTDVIERIQTAPVWVRKLIFRSVWLGRRFDVEERIARDLSMLFIDHGESAILSDDHDLEGRRVPNVMLPDGRLFEKMGRFGLILDRDGDAGTRALGAEMGVPVARLPRALDELGFDGVEALFVRPDHVIARARPHNLTEADIRAALALTSDAVLRAAA